MRYRFYKNGNKTICVSHFAGKPVRGVAICAADDEHDDTIGEDLARLRCDIKIAEKRRKHAYDCVREAKGELDNAIIKYTKYLDYAADAYDELTDLEQAYEEMMDRI